MKETKKTLIVLLGPTGVGKTVLCLHMAEHFGCPIINADSRQIYRDIPIGTAAPTAEQQAKAKHYFVGNLALDEYYSAAKFEEDAINILQKEFETHDVMLLSGGSMMYIDAVCQGIDDIPTISEDVRQTLHQRYEKEGLDTLLAELRLVDPQYYAECDIKNHKRVVHALEVYYQSGQPFSSFRTRKEGIQPINPKLDALNCRVIKIGLHRKREELFERINERVVTMYKEGLLEETQKVLPWRHCNSLNTVGFKEMFHVIDGDWDIDFALARMAKNTRVYAKKQLTWFAKDKSIMWFSPTQTAEIFQAILTQRKQ